LQNIWEYVAVRKIQELFIIIVLILVAGFPKEICGFFNLLNDMIGLLGYLITQQSYLFTFSNKKWQCK